MPAPITIENEFLRLRVWPLLGANVSGLVDKFDNYELLHAASTEFPITPRYDLPFTQSGWSECFPAVAPGPYPGEPYNGIAIPDHGELWSLPTTAVPTQIGITTVWHGLRFGYRFVRKLYLRESTIVAEYTLVNLAPLEFRYVWALHAKLSGAQPVQIVPFKIEYPTRLRSVSFEFASSDGLAHWRASRDDDNVVVGPMIGSDDALSAAVDNDTAGRVRPMATCKWAVRMTVAPRTASV